MFGPLREVIHNAIVIIAPEAGLRTLYRSSLYRNSLYLVINSVILSATGFLFWIVAARIYATETVGLTSAAISATGLIAAISTLGLNFAIVRFLPAAGEKAQHLINTCLTTAGLLSILLALIFVCGIGYWSSALLPLRDHPIFLIMFLVTALATTLSTIGDRVFVATRKAEFTLIQGIVFDISRFVPLVVMAAYFKLFGAFAAWGIALVLAISTTMFVLIPRVKPGYRPRPTFKKEILRDMVHFSASNYLANLFALLPQLALPIMVVNRLGAEQNAYFYIAWSIVGILYTIPLSTGFSLLAEGSHSQDNLRRDTMRTLSFTFVLLLPSILVMVLVGNGLLQLFGSDYSENAYRLLWILAIAALPMSINFTYFGAKRVRMEMRQVVTLSLFIAAFTLGLSYVLLPRMGISGAGIGWLAAHSVVAASILARLLRRNAKVSSSE